MECLKDSSILKEDTLIIVEASLDTSFDYLSELGFTLKKLKTYKTNVHAFITKAEKIIIISIIGIMICSLERQIHYEKGNLSWQF